SPFRSSWRPASRRTRALMPGLINRIWLGRTALSCRPPGAWCTLLASVGVGFVTDLPASKSQLVLPVGTQIVIRAEITEPVSDLVRPAGAVAEIVGAPDDATGRYHARFPDGVEVSLGR